MAAVSSVDVCACVRVCVCVPHNSAADLEVKVDYSVPGTERQKSRVQLVISLIKNAGLLENSSPQNHKLFRHNPF
jgi:hypothetical protein